VTDPPVATYPPAHHVLRDLGLATELGPGLVNHGHIDVDAHLHTPTGLTHAGAIATLVDALGGGLAAVAAQPDWIATADLSMHVLARPDLTGIDAVASVVRRGRTTIVIEVGLTAGSAPLGAASMTFAVLPRRDGNPVITATDEISRMTMAVDGSGFTAPLETTAGIETVEAATGALRLPIGDYVRNSLGAVQGGVMATLAAAASDRALSAAAGVALGTVDLQVTYLSLAKVGPVETRTTVLEAGPRHGTAHVELVDAGAAGRLTTVVRTRAVPAT
jgi:uncharacterized protein (TIGR00369 family)